MENDQEKAQIRVGRSVNQFMGLILVNFLLWTSITQKVFHIFLKLIAQIIGVFSLYHYVLLFPWWLCKY